MDYNELIKNWHLKALDEDYFSKFVFEYLAFIAYLKKKKFTDAYSDRNAMQRLKRDQGIKDSYLGRISVDQSLKRSWESIFSELSQARLGNVSGNSEEVEEIKWWNCSDDQLPRQSDDRLKGVVHDLNDWENMIEFWYAIRNNLFHGGKDPEDERDKILVKHGYITLRSLVEIMLTNELR